MQSQQIGTTLRPQCTVCGSDGNQIYEAMEDRLFTAPGVWNLKKCSNRHCGLVWLDPMPLPDEIWKAYKTYYTHTTRDATRLSRRRRWRAFIQNAYWAEQFGYTGDHTGSIAKIFGNLLFLSPIFRAETEAEIRCLPAVQDGRLLDVGCGSGDWLLAMRDRGWKVEGMDFDEKAVTAARGRGMHVQYGSLEDQRYADGTFDAITLNHVIEHVPDPLATIRECRRILKPQGRLVLFTPNNDSLSHLLFKTNWRGLEPPRHLHIFSLKSMDGLLSLAGFRDRSVRPFIVTSVIYDSLRLKENSRSIGRRSISHWRAWTIARLFKLFELPAIWINPNLGDCLTAIARK